MELGWGHHLNHLRQDHEAGSRKEALPALPRLRPSPSSSKLNHFTGPACLPSSLPPHPSFRNLFLSSHLQPLNFPPLKPSINQTIF